MDFSFNEEQNLLKDSFARFMQDAYSFDSYRDILASDDGYSRAIWQQMAELQWQALPFAESDGGLNYGSTELLLLAEELGRGLCVEPYLANIVMAGQLIAKLADDTQKQQWLAPLMSGEQQISLAHAELGGRYQSHYCSTRAEAQGDQWSLNGHKSMVLNAPNADAFAVIARTGGESNAEHGLGAFVVAKDAAGLDVQPFNTLGGGKAAELKLNNVQAQRLGGEAAEALNDVLDVATAFTCADAYGAMQALLSKTAEYSKTRKQFGMPLGAFQVLQHRAVDMLSASEFARALCYRAAGAMDTTTGAERSRAASAIKAEIGRVGKLIGEDAVQLHGGMGMTDEMSVGHYFKRLRMIDLSFGNAAHHLRRFAALS